MKILLIPAKTLEKQKSNISHSALFHMKTRVGLKYFVNDRVWKPFFDSNPQPDPFKLNFTKTKIGAIKSQKRARIYLTW